jgi:glutamate/tyrosine decarboxylase-like PLP-dependent enzyme
MVDEERRNRIGFPERGMTSDDVLAELARLQSGDVAAHGPRNLRPSYFIGEDILRLANTAAESVVEQNMLYASSSFPSLKTIEQDLVAMALDLFHAPIDAGGTVTTGGSESNFMAVKTARDWAAANRPGQTPKEIVLAHTAHPSLEKAADLLGLTVRRVKHSRDFRADVAAMAAMIGPETFMIVGSAPPAAYATVDPIADIAALAARHGIWMHVDSCMGGFFLPFARDLGEAIPEFDFRLAGVNSLSADLHKFGFAPKGASLLLLRERTWQRYQDYVFADWPFGTYTTAGLAGSRAAAPLVAAWSIVRRLGRAGYCDAIGRIIALRKALATGVAAIPGLRVLGEPACAHLFVSGDGFDIFAVEEILAARGWRVARAFHPDSLQFWVNHAQEGGVIDTLLTDLSDAVTTVRRERRQATNRTAIYAQR